MLVCQQQNQSNHEDRGPLVLIKSTYPFAIASLDFLKLDKAEEWFEYVLVVTNLFTWYFQDLQHNISLR